MADATPPFVWEPGEHVTVIGDTGTGKSYFLAKRLLRYREYVAVFKNKSDPDDADKWKGFHRSKTAKVLRDERYNRVIIQPEYSRQAREGWDMLEAIWRQENWTVCIDELWAAERLGLTEQIERLLTAGRAKGISCVLGQQRPVATSRFAISQCTHLFTFRLEGRDIKTVKDATTPRMVEAVESLRGYQFAYYNRKTRYVGIGNAQSIGKLLIPKRDVSKSESKPLDSEPERINAATA